MRQLWIWSRVSMGAEAYPTSPIESSMSATAKLSDVTQKFDNSINLGLHPKGQFQGAMALTGL